MGMAIALLEYHYFSINADVCFESLSCINMKFVPSPNCCTDGIRFSSNIHFKLKETVSVGRISRER